MEWCRCNSLNLYPQDHKISSNREKEICNVLNSFDSESYQGNASEDRKSYLDSLDEREKQYVLCWIAYQ